MNSEKLLKVLLSPHVTNKTYQISETLSFVVFKVLVDSTKLEIKKSVENLFDVKVMSVRTLNVKGKVRKFGGITGKTKKWKKAYIRLAKGHNINFVNAE